MADLILSACSTGNKADGLVGLSTNERFLQNASFSLSAMINSINESIGTPWVINLSTISVFITRPVLQDYGKCVYQNILSIWHINN
jgi:hypothetical protein